ncbi:MAG: hypothetical protein MOGDAGHF_01982 [Rhodocyclaceae bacterium]|nr:hypothetical protein [Rhodocyclaceae bacterium]
METVFGIFVALIFFYVLLEWRLGRVRRESEQRYADLEAKTRWLYKMLDELQAAPPKTAKAPVAEAAPAVEMPAEPQAEPVAVPQRLTFADAPAEAAAVEPPAPKEPGWLSKLLFGGNILAKIGVVLLIFGVGSALKLAAEFGVLPAEARLGLAALFGVALGVLGWRKRAGHEMFGFALQGGGVAVLYLVVYFALTRYALLGTTAAFVLFVLLGIGGMLLAAIQDGRSLAVLGLIGAFLAPILASSDTGNHVVLFSYFTLLNLFIFGLSWFRSWRSLNVAGFLLTFAIGMNWGLKFYRPEYFPTTEPFLVVLFLIYSLIPIVFALRAAPGTAAVDRIDAMLLFGTPVVCGFLQVPLVEAFEYGLAWSAGIAGLYYLALAFIVASRKREELSVLAESLRWVGAALLTLAVPFAFGARATVALWALEGAAAAWMGAKRERVRIALAGLALQLVAGGYFLLHIDELKHVTALANDVFVGGMLVAVAGLIGSYAASRLNPRASPKLLSAAMLVWSALWLYGTGLNEIDVFVERPWRFAASLALIALPLVAAEFAGRRLDWRMLRLAALLLPAVLAVAAVAVFDLKRHPFADAAWISWLLAYASHFIVLRRQEEDGENLWRDARHALGFCVLAALSGWEASWQLKELLPEIRLARMLGWGVVPAALLAAAHYAARAQAWPLVTNRGAYLSLGAAPVALALGAWTLVLNFDYSGAAGGWRYVPVFSLLDLGQALVLAVLFAWVREQARAKGLLYAVLGGLTFAWVSAGAARTVHHWLSVPFVWDRLIDSVALQASWSILWTLLAIGLMIHATRRGLRTLWFAGFGLLGVVGLKLMLVDTAHVNTLGRTVSLLGVALLVIAASYFAPTPPKASEKN